MRDVPTLPPDPTGQQRRADANEHRRAVVTALGRVVGSDLMEIPQDVPSADRERVTAAAMQAGVPYIWGAALARDPLGGRRGGNDLLVKETTGYVPVLVVRHKVSDPGQGARTSPLSHPLPGGARVDPLRKVRPQPRDQLRLAHAQRQLQASGFAARGRATGGVIGMDADGVPGRGDPLALAQARAHGHPERRLKAALVDRARAGRLHALPVYFRRAS